MSSEKMRDSEKVRERFLDAVSAVHDEGLSHRDIAYAMGISESALSKQRNKEARRPSRQTVLLLQKVGINPTWVETGIGEMRVSRLEIQTAERSTAYDAPPLEGQPRVERESAGTEWQVRLSDEEAWLILAFRKAAAVERTHILRTAEALSRPAVRGTAPGPAPDPVPRAAAETARGVGGSRP